MKEMDGIDKKILLNLLIDGRRSFKDIADEVGVSKNAVARRFSKMKKEKIIVGATAHIDYKCLVCSSPIEMWTTEHFKEPDAVVKKIRKIPDVWYASYDQLRSNLSVLALLKKIDDLNSIKDKLSTFASLERVRTFVWSGAIKNIPENLSQIIGYQKPYQMISGKIPTRDEQFAGILDEIDMQIINKLVSDGRRPFRIIANEIGVTTDTVARRYKKLREKGTVKVLIQLDPKEIGYHGTLDSMIRLSSQKNSLASIRALSKIPDVFCIVETSGEFDLHVWSLIRNIDHLLCMQSQIASAIQDFEKIDTRVTTEFIDTYPGPRQFVTNT